MARALRHESKSDRETLVVSFSAIFRHCTVQSASWRGVDPEENAGVKVVSLTLADMWKVNIAVATGHIPITGPSGWWVGLKGEWARHTGFHEVGPLWVPTKNYSPTYPYGNILQLSLATKTHYGRVPEWLMGQPRKLMASAAQVRVLSLSRNKLFSTFLAFRNLTHGRF